MRFHHNKAIPMSYPGMSKQFLPSLQASIHSPHSSNSRPSVRRCNTLLAMDTSNTSRHSKESRIQTPLNNMPFQQQPFHLRPCTSTYSLSR